MKPRQQKRPKYLDPGTIIIIKQVFFGLLAFSAVILVITAVWYGTRIKAFTIDTVTVEGGVTINKDAIRKQAETLMEGSYLHLVPKRFAYAYPDVEIYQSLEGVDRIKNINVVRVSGTELRITFDEYLPDTLWCELNEQKKCNFLDEKGYSFGAAPSLSGESLVRYLTTERSVEEGVSPLSPEDYVVTKEFVHRLAEDFEWYITKIEVDSNRDVFYSLGKGGEIKSKLEEGVEGPLANLAAILQSKEFSHLKPGNFQYLDLRFGAKVYVNEEIPVIEEVATSTEAVIEEESIPEVIVPDIEPEVEVEADVEVEEEEVVEADTETETEAEVE